MYAREEENVNDEVVNYMHQHMEDHEGIILSGAVQNEESCKCGWQAQWIKKKQG